MWSLGQEERSGVMFGSSGALAKPSSSSLPAMWFELKWFPLVLFASALSQGPLCSPLITVGRYEFLRKSRKVQSVILLFLLPLMAGVE